jgi:hypothetical protein
MVIGERPTVARGPVATPASGAKPAVARGERRGSARRPDAPRRIPRGAPGGWITESGALACQRWPSGARHPVGVAGRLPCSGAVCGRPPVPPRNATAAKSLRTGSSPRPSRRRGAGRIEAAGVRRAAQGAAEEQAPASRASGAAGCAGRPEDLPGAGHAGASDEEPGPAAPARGNACTPRGRRTREVQAVRARGVAAATGLRPEERDADTRQRVQDPVGY